ncbi:tyrosine-protein phosphatase [Pseudooceanicola sp.]|uniref:tyrosine-protein phosphatase n=1 Tax=Pseudooceanicola sp. TaxID=1914328 RepID=UPI00261A25D0|nr:tyrosine-protein phosphatase [Pseudooceanicola sp.]MDF1856291.1 tyrosine-protein phosphatase [Pseudooceanicola sp.]
MANGPMLSGVHNIRGLGGHPTGSGERTRDGAYLRGDALRGLDSAGLAALLASGLTTILDLRSHHEVDEAPNPLADHDAVQYRHLPLYDRLATIDAMAQGQPGGFDMGLRYRAGLSGCGPAFAEALDFLAQPHPGTVLFHCTAGKDRTGLIAALLLENAEVGRDAVVADYARTASHGAGLIAVLRARSRARGTDPAHAERVLGSRPETMRATLDWLDREHGGAVGYLAAIGVPEATRAALRTRLLG